MKNKIKIRQARLNDIPQLLEIDREIWPQFPATKEMFISRIETFPEGQFVAEIEGQIIGSVFTQIIDYKDWEEKNFSWNEITDNGTIKNTHNPKGDSIYGVGLAVRKKFQGRGVAALLMIEVGKLTIQKNLRQIFLGARIPGYCYHSELPVEIYIKSKSKKGRFVDPELALYQKYGVEPIRPLPNYMPDPESLNYGVLMRWKNPFYGKSFRRILAWASKKLLSKYL